MLNRFNLDMSVPRQLMARCPACYLNFRTFFCDLTCAPDHANFMSVVKAQPFGNKGQQSVLEVNYAVTNYSVNALFDSCKNVQYSASNQKILDLLCGSPQDGCSPEKLVVFLATNSQNPLTFDMQISDDNITGLMPRNGTIYKCGDNLNMTYYEAPACGCIVNNPTNFY